MTAVEAVIDRLLHGGRPRGRAGGLEPRLSRSQRVDSGSYQLDYGDDDHVFLLTVQQIPRRTLGPAQPFEVGVLDGLAVNLTAVIVDSFVQVRFEVPESPRSRQLLAEHDAAFQQWAAALPEHPDVHPPQQPGARLLRIPISLADDVGTTYRCDHSEAGGSGTDWQAARYFLPAPPAAGGRLNVRLKAPGGKAVSTDFVL